MFVSNEGQAPGPSTVSASFQPVMFFSVRTPPPNSLLSFGIGLEAGITANLPTTPAASTVKKQVCTTPISDVRVSEKPRYGLLVDLWYVRRYPRTPIIRRLSPAT